MWPFRKRPDQTTEDATLLDAERHVKRLSERADRVHDRLRPRMDRNHWSETVTELWAGRPT